MYTVSSAALTLGVSLPTMRRWIAESGVGKRIGTDRTRVYITYDELAMLAFNHNRKMEKVAKRNKALQEEEEKAGEKLYTIVETAQLLNVSVGTVKIWSSQSNVAKKVIITDRKRVYISYSDIIMLANKHSISDIGMNQEVKELYSMKDITLLFGITDDTVRRWIRGSNIKKKMIEIKCPCCKKCKRCMYISSDDVLLLAEQYRPDMSSVDFAAYLRDVRSSLARIKRLKYD